MVAYLVKLKLQLLVNLFRVSVWQGIGLGFAVLYGLFAAGGVFIGLLMLRLFGEPALAFDVVVVVAVLVALAHLIAPVFLGAEDSMNPARFMLFGLPYRRLAVGLLAAASVGVVALIDLVALLGVVVLHANSLRAVVVSVVGVGLTFLTWMLLTRVSVAVGALVFDSRRARDTMGVLSMVAVVGLSVSLGPLTGVFAGGFSWQLLDALAGVLGWTPFAAGIAAGGDAAEGNVVLAVGKLAVAAVTFAALFELWQWLIRKLDVVSRGSQRQQQSFVGLGLFDRLPVTQHGVLLSRVLTYWVRDPRYRVSLVMTPLSVAILVAVLAFGPVGDWRSALLVVPLMTVMLLAWVPQNDIAFDNTAFWWQVSTGVCGRDDVGSRLLPVGVVGVMVIAVLSPFTVWMHGDWLWLPGLVGVCAAVLGSGLGLSAIMMTRFPYAAVAPGENPMKTPKGTSLATTLIQSLSAFGALVVAVLPVILAWIGLSQDSWGWSLASLAVGFGLGVICAWLGTRAGYRVYDRGQLRIFETIKKFADAD